MHEKETYLSAVTLVIWVCRGGGGAVTLHDRRRGMTQQGLHGAHPRQGHMLQHRVAVLFSISIHYQEIRNGCYRARKSRTTLQNKVRLEVLPEQLTLFVNTSVTLKNASFNSFL